MVYSLHNQSRHHQSYLLRKKTHSSALNLVQEAGTCDCTGRVPNPWHGGVSRLGGWSLHIIDLRGQFSVLANRDRWLDVYKMTFILHHRLTSFLLMTFGLKNAPSTVEHVMDDIRSAVKMQFTLVYLEVVGTFSRSLEEHLYYIRTKPSLVESWCMMDHESASYSNTLSTILVM